MQTSLTSRICSSSGKRKHASVLGFTLIELLISIAIIGTVTSIVLTKYGSFDSTVLLKGLAYEIGLTIREAQVRSVSAAQNSGGADTKNFDYPFGVSFSITTSANQKKYTSFRYKDSTAYPKYGVAEAEDIRTFTIPRTMKILDLCINAGAGDICGRDQLDVSFRRPKFKGLFSIVEVGIRSTDVEAATFQSATIKVGSDNGLNVFVVKVTSLGQVSVSKQ